MPIADRKMLSSALDQALSEKFDDSQKVEVQQQGRTFPESDRLLFSLLALSTALARDDDELRIAVVCILKGSR